MILLTVAGGSWFAWHSNAVATDEPDPSTLPSDRLAAAAVVLDRLLTGEKWQKSERVLMLWDDVTYTRPLRGGLEATVQAVGSAPGQFDEIQLVITNEKGAVAATLPAADKTVSRIFGRILRGKGARNRFRDWLRPALQEGGASIEEDGLVFTTGEALHRSLVVSVKRAPAPAAAAE